MKSTFEFISPFHNQHYLLTKFELELFLQKHGLDVSVTHGQMEVFQTAFVHRSYTKSSYTPEQLAAHCLQEDELDLFDVSFERLEFLGDSVISLVVTDILYLEYPFEPEGVLSQKRMNMVSNQTLASISRKCNLSKWLIVSRFFLEKEHMAGERIHACILESFVGACYLIFGYEKTRQFIFNLYEKYSYVEVTNYKQIFQEKIMKQVKTIPMYRIIESISEVKFTVEVYVQTYGSHSASPSASASNSVTTTVDVFKQFTRESELFSSIQADIEAQRSQCYVFGIGVSNETRKKAEQAACENILKKLMELS